MGKKVFQVESRLYANDNNGEEFVIDAGLWKGEPRLTVGISWAGLKGRGGNPIWTVISDETAVAIIAGLIGRRGAEDQNILLTIARLQESP